MAPRRPLPMGSASVQWLAAPLNVTFRGLAAVSIGFLRSGRRTRPHPDPFSITLTQTNNQDKGLYRCDHKKDNSNSKKFRLLLNFHRGSGTRKCFHFDNDDQKEKWWVYIKYPYKKNKIVRNNQWNWGQCEASLTKQGSEREEWQEINETEGFRKNNNTDFLLFVPKD